MKSLSGFAIAAAAILAACGVQSGAGSGEKGSSIPSQRASALSSDGSRIAYREYLGSYDGWSEWRLRMAYSDGTHPVDGMDPVPLGDYASAPAWSPDGTQLAFVSDLDGYVYVADLATGEVRKLNSGGWSPTWSPDGGKIAYGRYLPDLSGAGIYVMNSADGSGVKLVTSSAPVALYGRIDWSPDGSDTLAFDCGFPYEVCTVKIDGTGFAQLTSEFGAEPLSPAWSPDATHIAFSTWGDATGWVPEIKVMNADGSNVSRLAHGYHPTWSPDGSRIAFQDGVAYYSCCSSIYTAQTDGTGLTKILSASDGYSGVDTPAWSRSSTAPPPPPADQPPVASFTSSCDGLTCTFDSSGSTDDHGVTSREWTFGDGTTATTVDVTISHTYAAPGSYVVTLTVTDAAEQSATATQSITVRAKRKTR